MKIPEGSNTPSYSPRQQEESSLTADTAPRSVTEQLLADIWSDLLGVERVGINDNFLDLGGFSLLGIQMILRLQQIWGVKLQMKQLFDAHTIADLARVIERDTKAGADPIQLIQKRGTTAFVPLSYAQRGLWFLGQVEGASQAYHIPLRLRLRGKLDRVALQQALDRIVTRHEALRTTFLMVEGEPVQRIGVVEETRFHLLQHDLREHKNARGECEQLMAEESRAAFDLEAGPLVRGRLIQLDEEEHALLITMHHIVSDGWSIEVFLEELTVLYGTYLRGEEDPLPELALQYADYAVWQRQWMEGEPLEQQAEYWRKNLEGAPELLELPADHARPAQQDYAGATLQVGLTEQLTAKLKELSAGQGTTLYMTLLAGWAVLLGRLSGQQDIVIGTPVANRGQVEIEKLIGFFVNLLAVRTDLSGKPTIEELLKRVKRQALAAQQHQDIPFEQVVELVKPVRSLSHSPLFQVTFTWSSPWDGHRLGDLETGPLEVLPNGASKVDIALLLNESEGRIVGVLDYATALFEAGTVERYLGYFVRVLEGLVSGESEYVDRLPLLQETERRQLLYEWNDPGVEYPSGRCIHELFEQQVKKTPEAVAAIHEDESLSYGELNRRANRLAHHLRRLGVKADVLVGICMERGLEMVVALLGVLKAGGAYVPLDPAYPPERLQFMLEDSDPAVLLTQRELRGRLSGISPTVPLLDLTERTAAWKAEAETNLDAAETGLTSRHLAYVIYTSGSTGTPKGVMIEHRNVARLFASTNAWFGFSADDVWTLFHSYAFDFSVWEVWGALLYGGRLIVVPRERTRSPEDFYQLLCRANVTILNQTPSAFRQLIAAQAARKQVHHLRYVIFGGEALEVATLRPWYQQNEGARTQLVNMYGITETTVHVTYRPLERGDTEKRGGSPIGCRIPDLRAYLLDGQGEPVPVGVVGELYVGGDGLARGYLNRPELTAERFLKDPFVEDGDARMYKTGDLGRWLNDGTIEFLGRNDFQVKIRGFRIELGEIEARLVEHAGVEEAAVVAREDVPGEKRLVAYYTAAEIERQLGGKQEEVVGAEKLRAHLAEKLPEYMVPAAYVRVEEMPLTANGKLDRKGLPAPEGDAYAVREYEEPQGETEQALADIWADLLQVERVGRQDNFFELGGHSLLAVSLVGQLRKLGLQLDVRALFATPTLAGLAAATSRGSNRAEIPENRIPPGCTAITPGMLPLVELNAEEIEAIVSQVVGGVQNVQDIYPLAPLQEGILFHHLMGGEGDPYLLASLFSFDSRVRLERYLEAMQAVIDRHDILRTAVVWEGVREPMQVVWQKAPLPLQEVEIDAAKGDASDQLYERFNPRRHRIDVRQAPLLRACIAYDAAKARWLLLLQHHHLAEDNTSLTKMQAEIQAHLLGRTEQLSAPVAFRNLVAQAVAGVSREEHERFFRALLGDVDEPTAPFGLLDVQRDGTGIEESRMLLESGLALRVRERARKLGVSAASVCHVAWGQVLAKASAREDVVFGTVLFGRMQDSAGADRGMGVFINTLPVRIRIGGESAEGSVRRLHRLLGDLMRHEHGSLALAQRCSGVSAPAPLFTALLNYRHSQGAVLAPSAEARQAWDGIEWLRSEERTNYPLTLSVDDLGENFMLTTQAPVPVEARRVCEFMNQALESLVEALEKTPERAVRTLEVLPDAERRQVVYEWNDTRVEYPSGRCIHELFEQQVEKTPEAVAVIYEDRELSYGELNRRANRLAQHLRGLGVKPDVLVGICMERGLEMVVALLGVLKAGGAYVPLDPAYPPERLQFMLEDSSPDVLLTQRELRGRLSGSASRLVDMADAVQSQSEDTNLDRNTIDLTSEHLAYVIYTSGSTGRPKGVTMPHRALVNLLDWQISRAESPKRTLQFAALGFDVSFQETLTTLCSGGVLVLIDEEKKQNSLELVRFIIAEGVQRLFLPYVALQMFAEALAEHRDLSGTEHLVCALDEIITAGEQLRIDARIAGVFEHLPECRLENQYGPTEAHVVTSFRLPIETACWPMLPPIGRPIANTRVYILDGAGEPVAVGVAGEICIGGVQVARGYLNRPELTAERFLKDPFVEDGDARMYKTGDLGRWLNDGTIEFLGRNDFQVKIRGFRIELGEIEARLVEHAGVKEAAVVAREDVPGEKRLVAYYTAAEIEGQLGGKQEEVVGAEKLRAHLAGKLPEYMVPAAYVRVEEMPLTANGKLDRKGLPAPEGDAYAVREYEEPQGETEQALADIWADLLQVERVGRQDNFFELGGHSLLATRLTSRIDRALGVKIGIRSVFDFPQLSSLAAQVRNAQFAEFDSEEFAEMMRES